MANDDKIYLGIDWGEARIGLALGSGETRLASPYGTVEDAAGVARIAEKEGVDVLVIGAPYSIGERELRLHADLRKFIVDIKRLAGKPVVFYDETMTSKAADNLPGGKKDKASRDEIAAMIILQNYLDGLMQDNGSDLPN